MNETTEETEPKHVECPAAKDPAVRMFILAGLLAGIGVWCLTDLREPPAAWDMQHINEAASYLLNNWGPVVMFPGAAVAAVWAVLFLRRKCVADEEGICYAYFGKDKLPWGEVQELDASKLKDKQILYLRYGKGATLTLDAWKMQNFRDLVAFVETHVGEDAKTTK